VIVRGVLYRISKEGGLLMMGPVASQRDLLYACHESPMSMHPGCHQNSTQIPGLLLL